MVTICTTSLTFNNSTFCPHSVFMCFVWISEQTAFISLYNFNWMIFITETDCVYCAVRTWSLNVIQTHHYMFELYRRRPVLLYLFHYFSHEDVRQNLTAKFRMHLKAPTKLFQPGFKSLYPLDKTSDNVRMRSVLRVGEPPLSSPLCI